MRPLLFALLLVALLAAIWALWDTSTPTAGVGPVAVSTTEPRSVRVAKPPPADEVEVRTEVSAAPQEVATEPEPSIARSTFAGEVVDELTDVPLPGFELAFHGRIDRRRFVEVATTDEEGRFALALPHGGYVILHRARPGTFARTLAPAGIEVSNDAPREVVLRAAHPKATLGVTVTYTDAHAAPGASVHLETRWPGDPLVETTVRTDEQGRARLAVWDTEDRTGGSLCAWDEQGLVSAVVHLDPPLGGQERLLVLAPGAELEVVVRDPDERPVAEHKLLVRNTSVSSTPENAVTDTEGRHVFDGLFPGTLQLGVWDVRWGYFIAQEVEVRQGERETVEVHVVSPDEGIAVSGRVLDEEGGPLEGASLVVVVSGEPHTVRTDADGAYRAYGDPCEAVHVRANLVPESDVLAPDERFVAYGSRDVDFVRVEQARRVHFAVEVVDAGTGERISEFSATIDRGPGTETWSNSYGQRRAYDLDVVPGTRWRIAAVGYRVRTLDLTHLAGEDELRVELERGFEHDLLVLGADGLRPLADVRLTSTTGEVTRTDDAGRVHLESPQWQTYTVEREGYETETWDPAEHVLWDFGPLILIRAD